VSSVDIGRVIFFQGLGLFLLETLDVWDRAWQYRHAFGAGTHGAVSIRNKTAMDPLPAHTSYPSLKPVVPIGTPP
jgi:hypothetical protein